MKTYSTVHVIAQNKKGEILLLQRAPHRSDPGTWNCITGYIQERESAEDTALRELIEETYLTGRLIKTGDPFWSDHDEVRYVIVPSLIAIENEAELDIDEYESQAYAWVLPSDPRVTGKQSLMESLRRVGVL